MAQLINKIVRHTLRSYASFNAVNITSYRVRCSSFSYKRTIVTTSVVKAVKLFTEKHEWIEVEGRIGTVGISDYAQDALGDVVYAQLPEVGSTIKKEEEVGALESVKAASEVISPVSGKVVEKNESVEAKPGLINSSCYQEGWLFKVELTHPGEIESLMNETTYEEYLKTDPPH